MNKILFFIMGSHTEDVLCQPLAILGSPLSQVHGNVVSLQMFWTYMVCPSFLPNAHAGQGKRKLYSQVPAEQQGAFANPFLPSNGSLELQAGFWLNAQIS